MSFTPPSEEWLRWASKMEDGVNVSAGVPDIDHWTPHFPYILFATYMVSHPAALPTEVMGVVMQESGGLANPNEISEWWQHWKIAQGCAEEYARLGGQRGLDAMVDEAQKRGEYGP